MLRDEVEGSTRFLPYVLDVGDRSTLQRAAKRLYDEVGHIQLLVKTLLHRDNVFDLIVNVASTAGVTGRSGWRTYSASKSALITMSEVMREERSIYDTRVARISPGRSAQCSGRPSRQYPMKETCFRSSPSSLTRCRRRVLITPASPANQA